MRTIALEDGEVTLLRQLLTGDQARLLLEIAHTDAREYKAYLRERETALEAVLKKLG